MNGDSGMYTVQFSDLHGERTDEKVVEDFLKAMGHPTSGNGIQKLMRAVALLILDRPAPHIGGQRP